MLRIVFVISLIAFFGACQSPQPSEKILGAWKVDSTYNFYNGFDFTEQENGADWAILLYEDKGTVKEIKFNTYQEHHFEFVRNDSMVFKNESGKVVSSFRLKFVDDDHLILRKDKAPVYAGKNQKRYELRYFSRTTPPQNLDAFNSLESKEMTN